MYNINEAESLRVNLGAHVPFRADVINLLYSQGLRSFQIFIGAPQSLKEDYAKIIDRLSDERGKMPADINIIVHGKYVYNFVKGTQHTEDTLSSVQQQLIVCYAIKSNTYVTHVGARHSQKELNGGISRTEENSMVVWKKAIEYLLPTLENLNIKLCFENTAGSKGKTYMGSIEELLSIVSGVNNYNRVGYCIDTQHAWANGEAIFKKGKELFFDSVIQRASLIHLNANEEGVEYGSHRDRHSSTNLIDSKGLPINVLKRVFEIANAPLILERESASFIYEEVQKLAPWFNKG